MIEALFFLYVFAFLNLFSGGRWWWQKHWRGRPVWYASIALAVCLMLYLGTWQALIIAGSFLLWRTPGWYGAEDAGVIAHTPERDFLVMFARGLLFPAYWIAGGFGVALMIAQAFGIAVIYRITIPSTTLDRLGVDRLAAAEWFSGAWIGACVFSLIGGAS